MGPVEDLEANSQPLGAAAKSTGIAVTRHEACSSWGAGHNFHWIQVLHSRGSDDSAPVPCAVVAIRDDGTVVLEVLGKTVEVWHHDPRRLRFLAAEAQASAPTYEPGWSLLRFQRSMTEHMTVSVCLADRRQPCVRLGPDGGGLAHAGPLDGFPAPDV